MDRRLNESSEYEAIAKTSDGIERLKDLLGVFRTQASFHDRRTSFFLYFAWLLVAFMVVALAYPNAVDNFGMFGLSLDHRGLLLALVAPVLAATMYMFASHNFLRNVASTEHDTIMRLVYPELRGEVGQTVLRPDSFLKTERILQRIYQWGEADKLSLTINTGVTLTAIYYAVAVTILWTWTVVFLELGFASIYPYLSMFLTGKFAQQSRLVWAGSKRYFGQDQDENKEDDHEEGGENAGQ